MPWIKHWIVPIHKKKEVFKVKNYRGVHLTSQVSKVVERLIGSAVDDALPDKTPLFGPNQFAYTKDRGGRDALAFLVLSWIAGFNQHKKFASTAPMSRAPLTKSAQEGSWTSLPRRACPDNCAKCSSRGFENGPPKWWWVEQSPSP